MDSSEFTAFGELPRCVQINFVHPSTFIISGPTGSGKTTFLIKLLTSGLLRDGETGELAGERIVWFHGADQPKVRTTLQGNFGRRVEFHDGIKPEVLATLDPMEKNIVVVDDLMAEGQNSPALADLMSKGSHHSNTSVFYLVQNLFEKGKKSSTITKNAHYLILFKNPRNAHEIRTLGSQLSSTGPGFSRAFYEMFDYVTGKDAYSYLVLDFRPETLNIMRYRTGVLPGEQLCLFELSPGKV